MPKLTTEQELLLAQFIAWGPTGSHALELAKSLQTGELEMWASDRLDQWVKTDV